jgi:hypothetical protein
VPWKTRPTRRTIPAYFGECETCDVRFESQNAFGLAAQHHARTGHQVRLESTTTFIWDANDVLPEEIRKRMERE